MVTKKSILPAVWEVPHEFRDRLGDQPGRQRLMQADGHLLLVLHRPPKPDEEHREGRFFWRKPDGAWLSTEQGAGLASLVAHLDEYDRLLEECDKIEEKATTAAEYFQVVNTVTPLARSIRNMHQALQEARQAMPDDRDLINLRDRAYDLERTADLLHTDARNGLEYAMARRAEEQAEAAHRMAVSAHRLNTLAAFFFPIATLSAIFGANLRHGWEDAPPPTPFLLLLAAGVACGFVLRRFIAR